MIFRQRMSERSRSHALTGSITRVRPTLEFEMNPESGVAESHPARIVLYRFIDREDGYSIIPEGRYGSPPAIPSMRVEVIETAQGLVEQTYTASALPPPGPG